MMKTLQDYPGYASEEATLNALGAKRAEIEKELQAIDAQMGQVVPDGDLVADALSIKPGYLAEAPDRQGRRSTLNAQVHQLARAMEKQHQVVMQARRRASQRLFAENAATWQQLAGDMVGLVDQIIAANEALRIEAHRLSWMGCEDVPDMAFPEYGLAERLPYWRNELKERLMHINFTIEASTNGKE